EARPDRLLGLDATGYFKDGINDYVVGGHRAAVNPAEIGTKLGAHYRVRLAGGGEAHFRMRLTALWPPDDFTAALSRRRAEADEYYAVLQEGVADADARLLP